MFRRAMIILTVSLLFVPFTMVDHADADGITDVKMHLLDHSPVLIDGKPRMLIGVLNVINITVGIETEQISAEIYPASGIPEIKNETNYYLWSYNDSDFECIYDDYIDRSKSRASLERIEFVIGTSAYAELGLWNLTVRTQDDEYSLQFTLDIPEAGIGISAPDFYFTTSPFSGENYNSSDDRMYFRTVNTGNIPLKMKITYDSYSDFISTTNTTGIFEIGEERYHYLAFETPVWGPRKVEITGSITGEPFYVITPDIIRLIPVPKLTYKITLEIVRPGFRLLDLGDVQVQYKQTATVQYEDTIDLEVYLTGNTEVTVSTSAEKISLESTTYRGAKVGETVDVVLSNTTEKQLNFTVKGVNPNQVGELLHTISWDDNEDIFVTEITTGPAPEDSDEEGFQRNILGLLFAAAVIGIGLLFVFKSIKGKEKETERDRKRREWLERHKGKDI